MTDLDIYRAHKDEMYRTDPRSPLTTEQKNTFTGLKYFPEDPRYIFEVRPLVFPVQESVEMLTTSGKMRQYTRHARFSFSFQDQIAELTIYSTPEGLFIPFVDSLAGTETYPGGRYLDDPAELPGGRLLIDFNMAYNPYCAYSDGWSCAVPPAENRLKVPIRAGEKIFQHE